MIRLTRLFLSALAVAGLTALSVPSAGAEDAAALTRALAAAEARDWAGAEAAARPAGPVGADLIRWQRLRAGQGSWADYRDFAARHPDWPGMELLYRQGEAAMVPVPPAPEVRAWFGERRPATLTGVTALIAALDGAARDRALAEFWTHAVLDPAEEAAFLAVHGPALAPLHGARLRALLDAGEWAAAERTLPLVTGPEADLARARIAVQARRAGVDTLILALPPAQRDDAGLALDRFLWRVAARRTAEARALMLERSTSAEALRDPARWAPRRKDDARAALRAGDWALAERLAANHFLSPGEDAADLDWLAGYAALRAGAADRAAAHFSRLPLTDSGPITLSRTLYWLGRAAEAGGDRAAADKAYAQAARHQSAFYGQLAAERIGAAMDPALAVPGRAVDSLPDWRGSALMGEDVVQAGIWLIAAGRADQGQRFFLHRAETAAHEDIARLARLMLELRRPWDALRLAKAAAARGGIHPAAYYPLTGLEGRDLGLPPELVLAIARRESEFNHAARSPVGARGLMQVMPDTARQMARMLGLPYDQARLTRDAAYNARLGAAYLSGLRARFGTSIALVAAGYNAGPGRSARWLRDFGDLRRTGRGGADPVDWVEMIPFDETRTYVMRVAEALPVYRARIKGRPVPIVPTWDLRGGGLMPAPRLSPLRLALSDRPPVTPSWVRAAAVAARAALDRAAEGGADGVPVPGASVPATLAADAGRAAPRATASAAAPPPAGAAIVTGTGVEARPAPQGAGPARPAPTGVASQTAGPDAPAVSGTAPAAPVPGPSPALADLPPAPILERLGRAGFTLPPAPPGPTATR